MNADLDTIGPALFAALAPLKRTAATPTALFEDVDYYADDTHSLDEFAEAMLNRAPCALLAFDGEINDPSHEAVTTAGETLDVGRASWSVYVAVSDPRGDEAALTSVAGQPGLLKLCKAVRDALNRLPIADTWGIAELRYKGTRKVLVRRGQLCVYALRFESLAVLGRADPASDSIPVHTLDRVDGAVHLPDAPAVAPADPIAVTRNTYP